MTNPERNLADEALDRYRRGLEFDHIEVWLKENGAHEEEIVIIIRNLKEFHYERKKQRGFKLVFAGCILLVFGFIITLLLYNTGVSINYSMYGLTTLGVILLLWGMIDIMGW